MAQKKPKKGNIIELNKYIDKAIRVKFTGGREVVGILKGYDQLVNVVLDDTEEYLRDPVDPYKVTEKTRTLGLTVIRGTSVLLISPVEGTQEIPNPFNSEQKAVI